MDHVHNEAVLAFLKAYQDEPGVKRFLAEQDQQIRALNRELGTRYEGYLEYLEANIGDDASFYAGGVEGSAEPGVHGAAERRREGRVLLRGV